MGAAPDAKASKLSPLRARHGAFYAAAGFGLAVLLLLNFVLPRLAVVVAANAASLLYLVLTLTHLPRLTEAFLRAHADEADAPAPLILFVTAAATALAMFSLFRLVNSPGGSDPVELGLSVASVVLGWLMVNTMWAMHYSYEYYESATAKSGAKAIAGGLDFPGGEQPDGPAFVYFSYVLGMTAQTSDVNVTSNRMRRLVTLHSLFAFFFNTAILAATVNIAVSLG